MPICSTNETRRLVCQGELQLGCNCNLVLCPRPHSPMPTELPCAVRKGTEPKILFFVLTAGLETEGALFLQETSHRKCILVSQAKMYLL